MIVPGSANSLLLAQGASTGYNLTKSLRFRASASAYLNRTPSSQTNTTTWTWSGWVKRGRLSNENYLFGGTTDSYNVNWHITSYNSSSNALYVQGYNAGSQTYFVTTNAVFRDPSAWYHVVIAMDTTQATDTNRLKIYVNGVLQTLTVSQYPTQNLSTYINRNCLQTIGNNATNTHDGEMTEINFIDGQALTPSSFGENNADTGVWQPIRYTGTYGTNGFYLPFTDTTSTTTLGYDSSGNGNNWTTNNFSLTAGSTYDSMTDVPTLTSANVSNYCVLNPLDKYSGLTLQNGNLDLVNSATTWSAVKGSFAVSSGKWYWENTITSLGNSIILGAGGASFTTSSAAYVGITADSYGYTQGGGKYNNATQTVGYGASYTTGDVIGVALDMDAGTITFYKNNVSQGTAYTGITGAMSPAVSLYGSNTVDLNFGQQGFKYTPPTGYVALNTYNLPTSTIVKGNTVMDATLYTGTGSSLTVTNAGAFKPDLVWLKSRGNAFSHRLVDSVRGTSLSLFSNLTNAETSESSVTAFNSNGFTVGTNSSCNTNADTYVGWQWQAGQGTTSSNTNGSITSTVSVNATAGFSIVKWTALASGSGTVGHGLGVTPSLMFWKSTNSGDNWTIYHQSLGVNQYIFLNTTAGAVSSSGVWGTINSTTFNAITGTNCGANNNYVSYCWAEIAGFSKFGSYTGNGSTDGPFIYLGFRPKFVMIKRTDSSTGADWWMMDSSRSTYNVVASQLCADLSHAEFPYTMLDFVSNGIKLRDTDVSWNASGGTYIYAAFAENPFKNALAR